MHGHFYAYVSCGVCALALPLTYLLRITYWWSIKLFLPSFLWWRVWQLRYQTAPTTNLDRTQLWVIHTHTCVRNIHTNRFCQFFFKALSVGAGKRACADDNQAADEVWSSALGATDISFFKKNRAQLDGLILFWQTNQESFQSWKAWEVTVRWWFQGSSKPPHITQMMFHMNGNQRMQSTVFQMKFRASNRQLSNH